MKYFSSQGKTVPLMCFDSIVLRKIFGPKLEEVTSGWGEGTAY